MCSPLEPFKLKLCPFTLWTQPISISIMVTYRNQNSSLKEIDPSGDLIVKVIEYDVSAEDANGDHPVLREIHMKVLRQVLMDGSKVFKTMLGGHFIEATRSEITLREDTVAGIEIWFLVLHGKLADISLDIDIKEIWEAIAVGQKYNLDARKLELWFDEYWQQLKKTELDVHDLMAYIYPCQIFDNHIAFAYVTHRIA